MLQDEGDGASLSEAWLPRKAGLEYDSEEEGEGEAAVKAVKAEGEVKAEAEAEAKGEAEVVDLRSLVATLDAELPSRLRGADTAADEVAANPLLFVGTPFL